MTEPLAINNMHHSAPTSIHQPLSPHNTRSHLGDFFFTSVSCDSKGFQALNCHKVSGRRYDMNGCARGTMFGHR